METLRARPPVWLIPRRAGRVVTLGGHHLEAGSDLLVSPYVLHHRPGSCPEPQRFEPDRWLPGSRQAPPREAFLAFGSGAHACPGERFATMEAVILLATIAHRWRLRPVPGRPVAARPAVTLRPSDLVMTLTRRTDARRSQPHR
jgi:pentalenene oxygenase